ncbi:MAG: ABC transporter permease [SAR324 cluster bacterium]|nr:ABC transporter permease [SAR324 cluster bacterium]
MKKTSLIFVGIAVFCLVFADIAITTIDPWHELGRMLLGAVTPDFRVAYDYREAFLNTLVFALCGIALGVVLGSLLAFFFHRAGVRFFCAFLRSIHEIFWAFIFLPIVGLNPVCGVLAIGIPYAGVFAKVYAEILQESDHRPLQGVPDGSSLLSRFFFSILPVIYADIKNYTTYRFECALRSSAILGFIGLPTIGFHLETAFRESQYSEVSALLYLFYLLIASLRYWLKPRLVPLYVMVAFAFLSRDISIRWENVVRFFTYEILPWPMRRTGYYDGTRTVIWAWEPVWNWAWGILSTEGLKGVWNTFLLTQIALVTTGIVTLTTFPGICRHLSVKWLERVVYYTLIVMRTTPEYILAYVFVHLWGPSMLPAFLAIGLHNGAILGYLTGNHANLIALRFDAPPGKLNRYFFEVLPRVYGQFLAFLFYRWEIMMRESAILGILGVYTLGFYIDSAISDDKLDKAFLLILVTAILNMTIDTTSQIIRKKLRVSSKISLSV